MRKTKNRKKSSPHEMPEIDDDRFVFLGRGLYADHARKSFGSVVVERSVLDVFGGAERAAAVLTALAASLQIEPVKSARKVKRKAA